MCNYAWAVTTNQAKFHFLKKSLQTADNIRTEQNFSYTRPDNPNSIMIDKSPSRTHTYLWAIIALTLLAAFLRYWQIASLAPEAWFDEVWFAVRARELLQDPQWIVFYRTPWGGGNALMVVLTAFSQLLGFVQTSTSRMVSAFWGVVSIPLAYRCFVELFHHSAFSSADRKRLAVLASGLLAILLHWVIISRVGTEPSLAPAVALFAVWMLKSVQRKPSQWWRTVFAGLALGISQYNGPHARFVLVLVSCFAFLDLLTLSGHTRWQYLKNLALGILAGMLAITPLAVFFWQEPQWLVARVAQVSSGPLNSLAYFLANLWGILRSFTFYGRFDPLMNYQNRPTWDLLQSIGFWVGHGWAVWNLRRQRVARELLIWEMLMVIPSLLTSDAPNLQRMINSAVGSAGLVAVGWWVAVQWILARWGKLTWRKPLLASLFALSTAHTLVTLFVLFPHQPEMDSDYIAAPVRAAKLLLARAQAGERSLAEIIPEADDIISFEYLLPADKADKTGVERLDFRQCFPTPADSPTRTSYILRHKRSADALAFLQAHYPTAHFSFLDFWQEAGALVEIPAHAPAPTPAVSVSAQFADGLRLVGYEWSGGHIPAGEPLLLTLWWRVDAPPSRDYVRFVHLGDSAVLAQNDGAPCQGLLPMTHWQTGDLIRDGFALVIPPETPAGNYPLSVGWYAYPELTNLPLLEGTALAGQRAKIADLVVEGR